MANAIKTGKKHREMPRKKRSPNAPPPYLVRTRGQRAYTFVKDAAGKRKYVDLGRDGEPETLHRYHELCAQVLAGQNGDVGERAMPAALTVERLVARFLAWARRYYVGPGGQPGKEVDNLTLAARPLLELYRDALATEIGPRKLILVREHAIREQGWSRRHTNAQIHRIRRIFRWGVEHELVSCSRNHLVLFPNSGWNADMRQGRTSCVCMFESSRRLRAGG